MNYIRHLNAFFLFVRSDKRLTSSHVSLYVALFQYWNFNRFQNPFPVYRENIMQISKIGSKNTYHKCIKELHQARYIVYYPSSSKFQPVKISVIRLDIREERTAYHQLDLFSQNNDESPSPNSGTDSVPDLTGDSTNIDTGTVSNMGHSIKQNNKQENSVAKTPTQIFEKNNELNEKVNKLGGVPNPGHMPTLTQVEEFFIKNKYALKEAHKFFYYNQGKNWMLTEKLAITDWKALAHKWMLNTKQGKEETMDIDKAIQYLYERFLEGEKINKLLLPEFADHLQLDITESIKQEALQRRINQLSGSNENADIKLWQAYMNEQWQNETVIRDEINLTSLAKRLAALKHFQKLKSKGQTRIAKE